MRPVALVDYRTSWAEDFQGLRTQLRALELADEGAIDHIGSTSVPGLPAKDVIDVQLRLPTILDADIIAGFTSLGYRHRLESWNNIEATRGGPIHKLVFAPPASARRANVHVRADATTGARDALLFRDFLRADSIARQAWGEFKRAVVRALPTPELHLYGEVKQPAWAVLMCAADAWAASEGWQPRPLRPWSAL
jgi:dephospho-CoA kinase